MQRRNILGVYIDNCDQKDAGLLLSRFLDETPPAFHQVCTVNPEFVMEARRNPVFKSTLNRADLCTPDGVGIILAGKLLRRPFRGRATGVGMVDQLGALSAKGGYSLYLLGAAPGVAEKAAAALQQKHPGATIAATYSGSPHDEDWPEIRKRLWAARPDVLLVAFGAPRQDLWIAAHSIELPPSVKVAMGVGGVFDYLSGRVLLAPALVRRLGLEWLFRLVMQPWRWKRILQVLVFGLLVLWQTIRGTGSDTKERAQA